MKKTTAYILSAICTQFMVCLEGLLFPQLRLLLKIYPSKSLLFLLYALPYLAIGIFLSLTAILSPKKQPVKKPANYLVPLSFTISNLLFLCLYFTGTIPLSSTSIILPLLLLGYGICELIYTYISNSE